MFPAPCPHSQTFRRSSCMTRHSLIATLDFQVSETASLNSQLTFFPSKYSPIFRNTFSLSPEVSGGPESFHLSGQLRNITLCGSWPAINSPDTVTHRPFS